MTKKKSLLIQNYYCDQCKKNNIPQVQPSPEKTSSPTTSSTAPPLTLATTTTTASVAPLADASSAKLQQPLKVSKRRGRPPSQNPKKEPKPRAKPNPKPKTPRSSKGHARKQCANPECVFESRSDSKYCSDDCGYAFNKLRYETYYVPKWKNLEAKHSQVRLNKMIELEQLEKDMGDVRQLIKTLKDEKEELEKNIEIIKSQAKKLSKENADSRVKVEEEDAEMEVEDTEETISADISKTHCLTCGHTIPSHKTFSHWFSCHKKLEGYLTTDVFHNPRCEEDENPKLYCHHVDKQKRYCMYLESACPQHSNWHGDKDEVCGCPLNIMQKIEPDGNYCLELKKLCTQHYHWDKFRLTQLNVQRIQAFARFETLRDKIAIAKDNLADTYGGVVGVMLHNTTTVESK